MKSKFLLLSALIVFGGMPSEVNAMASSEDRRRADELFALINTATTESLTEAKSKVLSWGPGEYLNLTDNRGDTPAHLVATMIRNSEANALYNVIRPVGARSNVVGSEDKTAAQLYVDALLQPRPARSVTASTVAATPAEEMRESEAPSAAGAADSVVLATIEPTEEMVAYARDVALPTLTRHLDDEFNKEQPKSWSEIRRRFG